MTTKQAIKTADDIPVHCACDEIVDVVSLVPNPRNPNTHPDAQIELLAKIIKHQGWRAPITVSTRSGFIVRGHGRLIAAQLLGVVQVPIDKQDYANEAAEWADLIADNKIQELSELDPLETKALIDEIALGGIDVELAGFGDVQLAQLNAQFAIPVEESELDESIADDIKTATCPECGHRFPL